MMKIEIGSNIKVICTNGVVEAGKLIEHTQDQMVLELIDKSYVIIQRPNDHVVAIKVSAQEKESRDEESVFVDAELKPDRYYRREDLRALNLAELQKMRAHEERKRAVELLRTHRIKSAYPPPEVLFGTPSFAKPLSQHPQKKTRRRS
jgi:hypothetical protein